MHHVDPGICGGAKGSNGMLLMMTGIVSPYPLPLVQCHTQIRVIVINTETKVIQSMPYYLKG